MLNGLDLFSGIGGISHALTPWVRPVAYCENERYAQAVLMSRMARGDLYQAPIWDDVRTLRGDYLPEVDIISGGFPCQDISVAGAGAGLGGERSGLFFEISRLARECRPKFIFLENVPAIAVRGLDRVLMELVALGYDCRWTIVSAAEVGAAHLRERWFLLGHTDVQHGLLSKPEHTHASGDTVRSESIKISRSNQKAQSVWNGNARDIAEPSKGFASPRVGRAGDGISNRMDRLHALGNAVVPTQTKEAFRRLIGR